MTDSRNIRVMSCEEFQVFLPELLGKGENARLHPHAESCGLCKSLIADLERIAEEVRSIRNRRDEDDEDGTTSVRSR